MGDLDTRPRGLNLYSRYRALAEERPEAEALILERGPSRGARLTWAGLMQRSEDLIPRLRAAGVSSGTRCGFDLSDHRDMLPTLLALWKLEAVPILLDPTWGADRRARLLDHAGASSLISFDSSLRLSSRSPGTTCPEPLGPGTAMLAYTSGSTGDPKAIPYPHAKIAVGTRVAAAAIVAHRGRAPARIGCSMRLSTVGVLHLHHSWAAASGATLVVLPELSLTNARDYWTRIEEHGVEQSFLVPPLIELLNHVALPRPGHAPPPICLTGSAPLSLRTQRRFEDRFRVALLNCYGVSEAMMTSFFGDYESEQRGSNGIGFPWLLEARVVEPATGRPVPGPGKGELQLAGPTVFDGYYGNPEATERAFDGRWLRTGDVVERTSSGRYHIIGRAKDVVMRGGFSVYLSEVEEAALAVDEVLEAAAVPVELPGGGEDLGILVRLDPTSPTSPEEVLDLIRDDLGPQRAPFRILSIDGSLPRTGQEKLDRTQIGRLWRTLELGGAGGPTGSEAGEHAE